LVGALVGSALAVVGFTTDRDLMSIIGLISLVVVAVYYSENLRHGGEFAAKERAISLFKTRTKKVEDEYWHDDPRSSPSTRPKTTSAKPTTGAPPTFVEPEALAEMQATLAKMKRRTPSTPIVPPATTPAASQPSQEGHAEFHVFTFSSPAAAMELPVFLGMIKGPADDEPFRFFRQRALVMSSSNLPARGIDGKEYELSELDGKWLLLTPADVVPALKQSQMWSRCRLVADVDMSTDSADMFAPHKKMLDVLLDYVHENWEELCGD
jgi:hypothetical protein